MVANSFIIAGLPNGTHFRQRMAKAAAGWALTGRRRGLRVSPRMTFCYLWTVRREADFFSENEDLPLVYVARRLKESLKVEELLTTNELDYLVEADTYMGGFLFRRELTGAFFYVAPADADRTRQLLAASGYRPQTGQLQAS